MFAEVIVEIKAKQLDQTFTYRIPESYKEKVKVGSRVLVGFQNRTLEGFVLNILETGNFSYQVKDILEVMDDHPVLNEELLEIGTYISKKTLCTKIAAYQTMLPPALKAKKGFQVKEKFISYVVCCKIDYQANTKAQETLLNRLKEMGKITKKEALEISSSAFKTLLEKKVIEERKEEVYRLKKKEFVEERRVCLTETQKQVVSSILNKQGQFAPFLLYGVTGSGKTEVYMHCMEKVIQNKKQVIVLVPEISLTPQMISLFERRFFNRVAILHSGLSHGEKYDEWRKIERGEVDIAIGARSAIFAPFTNLGLILVDEEHSSTYKQENNPRYYALDIALFRGKYHHCPVVFGSATPSIESYTRAKMKIYELLTLPERINKTLPIVHMIDMKEELKTGFKILSDSLKEAIENRLKKQEQVMLLLNRRGYSTIVSCHKCGYVQSCPNCDIPLIYHKPNHVMCCHYCNYKISKVLICPECGSKEINEFGMGTQKLEEIVSSFFPQAKVLRMDVDTTTRKGSHEKMILAFERKEYDILIGTQMIAKGLNFKDVTLVGVLQADHSLNVPDFRSAERTFQLLSQVAGRAGRGDKIGEVYLQGFNIDHYSIRKACIHDYIGFYEEELSLRKKLSYPPFCNLTLIRLSSKVFSTVEGEANKICHYLRTHLKHVVVLGPSTPSLARVNNIFYLQIILKYQTTKEVYQALQFLNEQYKKKKDVQIDIDLFPLRI